MKASHFIRLWLEVMWIDSSFRLMRVRLWNRYHAFGELHPRRFKRCEQSAWQFHGFQKSRPHTINPSRTEQVRIGVESTLDFDGFGRFWNDELALFDMIFR